MNRLPKVPQNLIRPNIQKNIVYEKSSIGNNLPKLNLINPSSLYKKSSKKIFYKYKTIESNEEFGPPNLETKKKDEKSNIIQNSGILTLKRVQIYRTSKPEREEILAFADPKIFLKLDKNPIQEYNPLENNKELKKHQEQLSNEKRITMKKKDYEEMVDVYSLHHLIIRKGKILRETPEFSSYKRIYKSKWTEIEILLKLLEDLASGNKITLIRIDGKKLADLVSKNSKNISDLLDCFVEKDSLLMNSKNPKLIFLGESGKIRAICRIQAFFRMVKERILYKRKKEILRKIIMIQKFVRLYIHKIEVKQVIASNYKRGLTQFENRQKEFSENWKIISKSPRIEIHINSLEYDEIKRLSIDKYQHKQNCQISRIFRLLDQNLEIIYVTPLEFSSDIITYYSKLFESCGMDDYSKRLHLIYPENCESFKQEFTTSKLLNYSPKSIQRIKRLINGKISYIVPGKPCLDDIQISNKLNVPLFQSSPQLVQQYSMRSFSRRIFQESEVPTPPSSEEFYEEKEMTGILASLIKQYPHIELWIFKINDQSNSTGFATFKVTSNSKIFKIFNNLEENDEKLEKYIKNNIQSKIHIYPNSLFTTYKEMLYFIRKKGCIIEASASLFQKFVQSPCLSFVINPDSSIEFIGSYEKLNVKDFISSACFYPQKSLPKLNPEAIIKSVGTSLIKKGVFGFVQIDLVSFPDPLNINGHPLFWAIGLSNYLNEYTSGMFFYNCLRNKCHSQRVGAFIPYIHTPEISYLQLKTFFHMCRINNVSYDVSEHQGSIFLLLDEMQGGVLSLLTMGETQEDILKSIITSLNFILKSIGKVNKKLEDFLENKRYETIMLGDIVGKVRTMLRRYEKPMQSSIKQI